MSVRTDEIRHNLMHEEASRVVCEVLTAADGWEAKQNRGSLSLKHGRRVLVKVPNVGDRTFIAVREEFVHSARIDMGQANVHLYEFKPHHYTTFISWEYRGTPEDQLALRALLDRIKAAV